MAELTNSSVGETERAPSARAPVADRHLVGLKPGRVEEFSPRQLKRINKAWRKQAKRSKASRQ